MLLVYLHNYNFSNYTAQMKMHPFGQSIICWMKAFLSLKFTFPEGEQNQDANEGIITWRLLECCGTGLCETRNTLFPVACAAPKQISTSGAAIKFYFGCSGTITGGEHKSNRVVSESPLRLETAQQWPPPTYSEVVLVWLSLRISLPYTKLPSSS